MEDAVRDAVTTSATDLLIACSLPGEEQIARGEVIAEDLFAGADRVDELPDGYAFRFAVTEDRIDRLASFIAAERRCCPFFTFELVFEPAEGPVWLRLRGPEGVKEFIRGIATLAPAADSHQT
jgi:hypothetical protein